MFLSAYIITACLKRSKWLLVHVEGLVIGNSICFLSLVLLYCMLVYWQFNSIVLNKSWFLLIIYFSVLFKFLLLLFIFLFFYFELREELRVDVHCAESCLIVIICARSFVILVNAHPLRSALKRYKYFLLCINRVGKKDFK